MKTNEIKVRKTHNGFLLSFNVYEEAPSGLVDGDWHTQEEVYLEFDALLSRIKELLV